MPHPAHRRALRRVILETVPRRDAAQRLNLAFTLLARDQAAQGAAPIASNTAARPAEASWGESPHKEVTR